MNVKRLRDVPLFSELHKQELETLAQVADEVDVQSGHVLTEEGDFGREFFVIDTGGAEVTRAGEHVADLRPGDFFGEIALIEEDHRRTATVTTTEPTTVIVLTGSAFRGLRHTTPAVYDRAQAAIAARR